MSSPENDKWLDDALSDAVGSKEKRKDFEQWKLQHPEAVEMLTSRVESSTTKERQAGEEREEEKKRLRRKKEKEEHGSGSW